MPETKTSRPKASSKRINNSVNETDYTQICKQLRALLVELDQDLGEKWDQEGPMMLLGLRIKDKKNETIIHHMCQQTPMNVQLARVLLKFACFKKLVKSFDTIMSKSSLKALKEEEFRLFVHEESSCGETALYQCLCRFEPSKPNKEVEAVAKIFIESVLDPNDFVNNRTGQKVTVLHLLIEQEQLGLLKYFMEWIDNSQDIYDPIDFTKKNSLGKTPLMVALETGNVKLISLISKKALKSLNQEEDDKTRAHIKYIKDAADKKDTNKLMNVLMQNKVITTTLTDARERLASEMEAEYILELDGRSFDFIWLRYLTLAKDLSLVFSSQDVKRFASDLHKQILVNRVNKLLSEKYTIVALLIYNYSEESSQLYDLLKYLPYNFKAVFVSPKAKLHFTDFYIKRDDSLLEETTDGTSNCLAFSSSTSLDESKFDSNEFLQHKFRSINEYGDAKEMNEDVILFKQALQYSDGKSLDKQYYEKLGDCYSILLGNRNKAYLFYKKAVDLWRGEGVTRESKFAYVELMIKTSDSIDQTTPDIQAEEIYPSEILLEAIKIGPKNMIVRCYESLSRYYKRIGDKNNELDCLFKALEVDSDEEVKARINNTIFIACNQHQKIDRPEAKKALDSFTTYYINADNFQLDKIALSYYNIGLYWYECGKNADEMKKGIEYIIQAINSYKLFYNGQEEHIDIANSYNNIGLLYENMNDHSQALVNYEKALILYEAIYQRDHSDVAMALNNFATCYPCDTDQIKRSYFYATIRIPFMIESYKMYKRLVLDNPGLKGDVAMASFNLGTTYVDLDLPKNAVPYFEEAFDLYKELDEKDEQLETLFFLDQCEKENEKHQKRIIETSIDVYGKEYEEIFDALGNALDSLFPKHLEENALLSIMTKISYVKFFKLKLDIIKNINLFINSISETFEDKTESSCDPIGTKKQEFSYSKSKVKLIKGFKEENPRLYKSIQTVY